MQVTADVGPALRSAAAFVHAQRSADGLWRDAGARAGVGFHRASAIVVWALGSCEGASEIVRDSARALLFRQHPDGGWAAGDAAPSDCDSTAWVLLALTRAPLWKPSAIERGVRYVAASLRAGPVNTGLAVQCLLRCGFARGRAAAAAPLQHLLRQPDPLGLLPAHQTDSSAAMTYHALKALVMARALDLADARRTATSLLAQQRSDGRWSESGSTADDVCTTAFVVLSLLLLVPDVSSDDAIHSSINWLLERQAGDGSWPVRLTSCASALWALGVYRTMQSGEIATASAGSPALHERHDGFAAHHDW